MRILVVSNYYPPYEVGGYEQLCRDVCHRLQARGHQITVLTSVRGVSDQASPTEPGIHRLLHEQISLDAPVMTQFFRQRRQRDQHNLVSFHQVVGKAGPDVIFLWNLENLGRTLASAAEGLPNTGVAYWLASRSPAEPDVYWDYWNSPGRTRRATIFKSLLRPLALRLLASEYQSQCLRMNYVGVVSEYMREWLVDKGALPPTARVIHNGVELDLFPWHERPWDRHKPLRLLQAGRVSEDKGVHTTVEAMNLLVHRLGLSEMKLVVAGSGPDAYRARLAELVRSFDIEDQVEFTGWLAREQMPALMAACDVLILATLQNEPLARVVLEAMASGLVVVGAVTGGMAEVLQEGVTGLTFAPGSADDLAQQIARLLQIPTLPHDLTRMARILVRDEFSLDHMVDQCEHLLIEARDSVCPELVN